MDANSWLYTFSTAAQVVAALVGLFAVFVVYKIQDFSQILANCRERAIHTISYLSPNTKDYKRVSRQDLLIMDNKEILQIYFELLEIQKLEPERITILVPNFDKEEYDLFKTFSDLKIVIFSKLKEGLIIGFSIIAVSLILLASTQLLIPHFFLSILIMVLFLLLLLLFLVAVGKNIYDIAAG